MRMSCVLLAIHAKKSHLQKQKTKVIRIPEPTLQIFLKKIRGITQS